jgi:hypothetical protein
MSKLLRRFATAGIGAGLMFHAAGAGAANVRGTVVPGVAKHTSEVVGYTRTRILSPGKLSTRPDDLALFLKVKSSLPLPAPNTTALLELSGYRIAPQVAACAVDGKVQIKNSGSVPLTVKIGEQNLTIGPGETGEYPCVVGKGGDELRNLRVAEWPYARAVVFVGEVGVAGMPNEKGAFSLPASPGKYELLVIGLNGMASSKEVDLAKVDVDVGTIDLSGGEEAAASGSP